MNYRRGFWAWIILTASYVIFAFILMFEHNKNLKQILHKNSVLQKSNDSLEVLIHKNSKDIRLKDSLISLLGEKQLQIKYVYDEKYKEIDFLPSNQLLRVFDSIFAKNNVGR